MSFREAANLESCSIIHYFEKAVKTNVKEIAVTDQNGSYTYEGLDQASSDIAYYIKNHLAKENQIVGILMDRTKESISAMLGILKAGHTYMVMDKKYPMERIKFMVSDANVKLVLCDEPEMIHHGEIEHLVYLNDILENSGCGIPMNPYIHDVHHGAYIIYTSGSTGKPKGLEVSHFNLLGLYKHWTNGNFELQGRSRLRTAVISPFVFDMSVLMIFFSLFKGYHLYIFSDEQKQTGKDIVDFLSENQIDFMDATPNYVRLIDNYLTLHLGSRLTVKRMFCIGDVLSYKLAKNIINNSEYPNFKLYNTYGPAECTIFVTYFILDRSNIEKYSKVFIGKATKNSFLRIVDDYSNECLPGQVGELVILGDSVGNGYIGKCEIKSNPFQVTNGIKSYRTGDLVRLDESGNYEFIGRKDRQHKVNGYRIELEEIEYSIECIEGISEVKVLVEKDKFGFSRISAFYTGEREYKADEIRNKIKKLLPYYMIPQEILYCSEFPTTHNGKVDYAELRSLACDLEGESPNDVSAYASSMLCQLLDCKIDDLNRSFFEMGGNSITLLAFISGINDKFDLNVDISKVYQSKNLNNLLNYLGNLQADQGSCNHSFHRSCKELIPVIEPQKKLIIEEHKLMKSAPKELDIHRFSLLYQLIFRKSINVSRMKNAINLVMLKNEIFYVRFLKKGNRYFMKLDDEYHRIEIKTKRKQEHILSNLSMFSLDRKEMIEFIWDDDTSCLYLHIKHILLDYISVQYFIDDILKAYYHTGELPERKGFFSYLSMRKDMNAETGIEYWKEKMKNKPARTCILADSYGENHFDVITTNCTTEIYECLKDAAAKHATSIFVVLLSAFLKVVSEYSRQETLLIGCYFPGRNYRYDNGILGMFTNVLPLIINMTNGKDGMLLNKVEQEILDIMENQDVSLSKLYQLMPLSDISDGELFDICFNYQNDWIARNEILDQAVHIQTMNIDPDITNRDFYFGVIEENGGMRWEIKFNRGKYSDRFIHRFIHDLNKKIVR
ncbi:AMP-binding protein [Paenibacillus azoreducens]|uniref:amino acid adenylation domain-containing protein n=1 Tax=Paenibacillus azoreducens TaxID=116718 RepID=UPI0039F63E8D